MVWGEQCVCHGDVSLCVQGQTCWRSTWWRSAACASAWRSPSAPTTGSGSSSNAAWPPPGSPVVRHSMRPLGLCSLSAHPLHIVVLGKGAQHLPPCAGLPSDIYAQGPELGLQLSRENQALREDNRTLRLQCDQFSRGRVGPPVS